MSQWYEITLTATNTHTETKHVLCEDDEDANLKSLDYESEFQTRDGGTTRIEVESVRPFITEAE